MQNFKTISEYEILKLAYDSILKKYFYEENIYKRNNKDVIAFNRMKKYNEQLTELRRKILEIENSRNS